jgi:hypothetical protein
MACTTAAPIPGGQSSVTLTLYQIGYVVSLTYIPSTEEVDGVVNATQQFLSGLFQGLYSNMIGFETTKVSDRLMLNAPYEIVYNSTIDFAPGTAVPSLDELNSQLQTAFTGDAKASYLTLLAELGPENIFGKWTTYENAYAEVRVVRLLHTPLVRFTFIPAQTSDVVFTFFETSEDSANGQSHTGGGSVSSPIVLAAIGAGTLAVVVTIAATVHFFKHRSGDPKGPDRKSPPPDYATHAAESTIAVDDYPYHGGSTATGEIHSCMSPTSNASHTDETEPASGNNSHRNPRIYRLSRQAIESNVGHIPAHRDGTNACIIGSPMQQSLSFEGDDDDEPWMNPSVNDHSSSAQGEAILSTSENDESRERRRHQDDQVPMPLLY